jgi:hypothetical protein
MINESSLIVKQIAIYIIGNASLIHHGKKGNVRSVGLSSPCPTSHSSCGPSVNPILGPPQALLP